MPDGGMVCVTGGRDYHDRAAVFAALRAEAPSIVLQGGARGADLFARAYAREVGCGLVTVEAEWAIHGRKAGPLRNRMMLNMKPRLLLAFPGGRGTDDCVRAAVERGILVRHIVKAGDDA